ncbi:MAG: carboxymuconolactone decarboxylase family protein [Polyangiales bacterium]
MRFAEPRRDRCDLFVARDRHAAVGPVLVVERLARKPPFEDGASFAIGVASTMAGDDARGLQPTIVANAKSGQLRRIQQERSVRAAHSRGRPTADAGARVVSTPMSRDQDRAARAAQSPLVDDLPDAPGIVAAMRLSPALEAPLRGLADALLVDPFPNATLTRAERELIATAVSAANDCVYCMDSHGAFAGELLRRAEVERAETIVDRLKEGGAVGHAKIDALLDVARTVQRRALDLTRAQINRAKDAGATDGDVQLAVLIASAFCMYNRMVDGLRSSTPASAEAYRARASEIADHGYSSPNVRSLPR